MKELVSVIVPIYNVEPYLHKCVTSILEQTYKQIEVILVDDESPDRCGQWCDEWAALDQRIKVLHKPNGGLGDARNAGYGLATGTYILYVDSDDYIHKELVERAVHMAEKYSADMVLFDLISVDESGRHVDCYPINIPQNKEMNLNSEPRMLNTPPSAVNKLFRRAFLKATGISFTTGRYYEDLATIPKWYAQANNVVYMESEPMYYYLLRGGSIMHSKDYTKNYEDRCFALLEIYNYYKQQGLLEEYQKEIECLFLCNGYFIPCKEIVLADSRNAMLEKFRSFIYESFPNFYRNPYIREFTKKDKILFWLLRHRRYETMLLLSYARRAVDYIKKK